MPEVNMRIITAFEYPQDIKSTMKGWYARHPSKWCHTCQGYHPHDPPCAEDDFYWCDNCGAIANCERCGHTLFPDTKCETLTCDDNSLQLSSSP